MTPPVSSNQIISSVAAFTPAWDRMVTLLFKPFDLGRWLRIGLCAFLATLGEMGAGGSGSGTNRSGSSRSGIFPQGFSEVESQAKRYLFENLAWIIPLIVFVVVVGLAVTVLILWLRSRGQFMFLDNVATGRADVKRPWHENRMLGNNLFWFRLGLTVLTGLGALMLFGGGAMIGLPMLRAGEVNAGGVMALVFLGFVFAGLMLVSLVIGKLTTDFVVPVMWLRGTDWRAGWGEVGELLKARPGNFLLYLLFLILLSIVWGVVLIAVVLLTCCVAGCLLAIPYVGSVLLLPMTVFFRAFSLSFLAQFGPSWDVFQAPVPNG